MEPILTYQDVSLTLVELILGAALLLLGVILAIVFGRRGPKPMSHEHMQQYLTDMADKQSGLQGRMAQMAEDAAAREDKLRTSLDHRLDQVSHKVGKSLSDTQERSTKNLKELHERLALIDRAQKNIETLSGEVSSLQSLLSNKQARGAFGEKAMQDLITNFLPPSAYSFQETLSNGKRVDALIHLPADQGHVAVDSKFPMESWRNLTDADNDYDRKASAANFKRDVSKHINDIADKYLIFEETYEIALLFLPSEAIYAELHTNFADIVDKGFSKKVMIVSPTTFMATLHTMRAVMKDAAMREQAHIIQKEVGLLSNDVRLLSDRTSKLQTHFNQAAKDIETIMTSSSKIAKRSERIENLDMPEQDTAAVLDGPKP